jgi:hypothetical protein
MAVSVFKIKRSSGVAAPTDLKQGELALTYGAGTHTNMGDRLFIGTGDEVGGVAEYLDIIGGKYFTELLDHLKGVATADSAVILDENKKINQWRVDKVEIDGSGISIDSEAIAGTDLSIDVNGTDTLKLNTNKTGAPVSIGHTTSETTVNDNLTVTGNLAVSGVTAFSGDTTFTGAIDITGDLDVDNINLDGNSIVSSTGVLNVDADGVSSLNIGTVTSGSVISIGHTTSETTVNDNLTVVGDLIVNGTQTTLNVATISVDDKNIELGAVTTPTDTTADLGGLTLKGATDKTISWHNADDRWHFNQGIDIDSGDLIVAGDTNTGTLGATGATLLAGTLDVTDGTTLADTLEVTGVTTFLSDIDFDGSNIDVSTQATDINILDNSATAFTISEGANNYAIFHTTNAGEKIQFLKDLDIDGNVDISGNLTVQGLSTLNGGTLTLGDSATDNVVFGADVNSNIIPNTDDAYDLGTTTQEWKDLFIDGTAHIDTLDVDDNATVTGTLGVTGATTLSSTLGVTSAATLSDTLGVTGATTLSSTLDVTGATGIDGDFDIATNKFTIAAASGNTAIAGTLDVTGNTTVIGTLNVTGAISPTTHLDMPDNAHVKLGTGDDLQLYHDGTDSYITNDQGALKIATEASATPITIGHTTSETTIADNLTVAGNALVSGNLTVQGLSTLNGGTLTLGDSATDNVVFGADVNSNIIPNTDDAYDLGSSTQEWSNLFIDGIAHIDVLDVDEDATIAGTLTVTGVLSPQTHIDMLDSANIKLGAGDDLQLYHDGTDSYIANSTGTLNIATISSGIPITIGHTTSEVTVAENLTVTGNTTINGTTLDVNANLEVTGTSTITGGVDITGDLDVDNLNLNGNTIISTDTDGHINITPDGTGTVIVESAVLNTDVAGTAVLDDDSFGTATSATLATSESIKAYVDTQITAEDLDLTTDSGTISIDLDSETLSVVGGEGMNTSATGNVVTVEGEDASDTNKGIASFASADFGVTSGAVTIKSGGVSNTQLDNSSVTINSNSLSLGGTITLDSDDIAEGSLNLYATAEVIDDRVSNLIVDGEGITTTYDDAANTLTIDGEDASSSNKGVASFDSAHFSVTSGAVSIGTDTVDDTLIDWGTGTNQVSTDDVPEGSSNLWYTNERVDDRVSNLVVDGEGITTTYNDAANTFTIDAEDATDSNKGVASFATADFDVTTGAVTIKNLGVSNAQLAGSIDNAKLSNSTIVLGSDTVNLGDTITDLNALTSLDVDNLTLDGNTISSTNTNGDILLDPNGTGSIDVNNARIINIAEPSGAQDAVTKQYVDAVKSGLDIKDSARMATTANLSGTYNNGTAGVGATLTNNTTQAAFAVDSVTASLNDRVLVKDQTAQAENGIYTVTTVGSGAANWVLTRATDVDGSPAQELDGGTFVFVEEGSVAAENGYVFTHDGIPTIGTTALTVSQFSGAGQIIAGDALTKSGNTLDVAVDDSSIEVTADALNVKALGISNSMLGGSIANAKLSNSSVTINSNSLSLGGTLTLDTDDFAEGTNIFFTNERVDDRISSLVQDGEAITTTYNDVANTFTIEAEIATSSNKGVATFNTSDFDITTGDITIKALGVSNAQLAGSIDLTTKVTGTLPVASGGTGDVTWAAGGVMYGDDANDLNVTAAGSAGYFLYSNSGTPDWTNVIDGGTY